MSECRIRAASDEGIHLLQLEGDVRLTMCTALDEYCDRIFTDPAFVSVTVDVTKASGLDSTVLGMLAKLAIRAAERFGFKPALYSVNAGIDRLLATMGFAQLFDLRSGCCEEGIETAELPASAVTEDGIRKNVIEAHRTLMAMSQDNKAAFEALVKTLESS